MELIRSGLNRIVDVHSHIYLPRYVQMLRQRSSVPRVMTIPQSSEERLIILPGEDREVSTNVGRPIGPQYWDPAMKMSFMKSHGIRCSVVSLANPWLDFLGLEESARLATQLNEDMQEFCQDNSTDDYKLYGFGCLPMLSAKNAVSEIQRIAKLDRLRGIILGTKGIGSGMDDEKSMLEVYQALEENELMAFVHPHYGVGNEHFANTGHSLFLALGFPFETTVAISRLILSGMLDRARNVKLLIAHSGGTLPFLAGRLDSCVETDAHVSDKLEHAPSSYLRRFYYDSLSYHSASVKCLTEFADPKKIFFGTDHPFFPPLKESDSQETWESCVANIRALEGFDSETQRRILQENAMSALKLVV